LNKDQAKNGATLSANERFPAHIVIPMWPERVPTSIHIVCHVYNVKDCCRCTCKSKSLCYHPHNYLNFYCLRKSEPQSHENSQY